MISEDQRQNVEFGPDPRTSESLRRWYLTAVKLLLGVACVVQLVWCGLAGWGLVFFTQMQIQRGNAPIMLLWYLAQGNQVGRMETNYRLRGFWNDMFIPAWENCSATEFDDGIGSGPDGVDQVEDAATTKKAGGRVTEYRSILRRIDPETGAEDTWSSSGASEGKREYSRNGNQRRVEIFSNRVWFVHTPDTSPIPSDGGESTGVTHEVVDGQLHEANFVSIPTNIPAWWENESARFLLNGQPAFFEQVGSGFRVWVLRDGAWNPEYEVDLPKIGDHLKLEPLRSMLSSAPSIRAINHERRLHVFLRYLGRILYREGLPLRKIDERGSNETQDQTASANPRPDGWSVVSNECDLNSDLSTTPFAYDAIVAGLVDKAPFVALISNAGSGEVQGKFHRLNESQWSEFATQTFPCGTCRLRCVTTKDGQKSYVVAQTLLTASHIFAVESTGVRRTKATIYDAFHPREFFVDLGILFGVVVVILLGTFGIGLVYGLCVWFVMSGVRSAKYWSGNDNVVLASLIQRGKARLLDQAVLFLLMSAAVWCLFGNFDWLTLLEAKNLHANHSIVWSFTYRFLAIASGFFGAIAFQSYLQSRWGFTLGKRCFGLRTLRLTLRSCGFTRSFLRELLFYVDVAMFLSWLPGIACIGLTNRRQRIGDLWADTVIISTKPSQLSNSL